MRGIHQKDVWLWMDTQKEIVRLLMRRDPLDSRKLMDSEARVLAELVKRHVDDDEFPTHLWKVTKGKKWTAFNAALRGAGHIDA